MKAWVEIRDEFRSVVFRLGVDEAAERLPASKKTIYRLIGDDDVQPCRAIVAGAERVIQQEHEKR